MSVLIDGKLSVIDKSVTQALANLGLTEPTFEVPEDLDYMRSVGEIVATALKKQEINSLVESAGLTIGELTYLYSVGCTSLLPEPLISAGKTLLPSTLIFMEPIRFRALTETLTRELEGRETPEDRLPVIASVVATVVQVIRESHAAAGKSASMPPAGRPVRASSGCLLLLTALPLALWIC